jgi:quinoprotein glucose dehydrogenase
VQYNAPYDFLLGTSCGLSMIGPPWSQLTAYDLNKGTILWQIPNGGVASLIEQGKPNTGAQFARGGVVVTAGGLVFVGTASDRMFRAYDKENGKVLWEYKLPAGQEGVPAVYEAGGRQYIVVPAGGDGQSPPSTPRTALGPSSYIAFALPKK